MPIEYSIGPDAPPFQEAVDAFLAKEIMTRDEFNALAASQKVKAFTSANVFAADQLQTVYNAVLRAIEKGTTLNDFIADVGGILDRPWHRETVLRTNTLAAYGKGHWDQAQAEKDMRPYGRYSAIMDGRTRPSHATLHGLIFPLDHPFWKTYWPPWDYNCRCGVTTLSQMEVDDQGLTVKTDLDGLPGPAKNFTSPAAGDEWKPDTGKYATEIGLAVEEKIKGEK